MIRIVGSRDKTKDVLIKSFVMTRERSNLMPGGSQIVKGNVPQKCQQNLTV